MVPPLFAGLVDDAAVLPPSALSVPDAMAGYAQHRASWYGDLMGAFLLPASLVGMEPAGPAEVGCLIGDTGLGSLPGALAKLRAAGVEVRQIEAAVARRGEDPQPGLGELRRLAADNPALDVYAEIPLSWGLLSAL